MFEFKLEGNYVYVDDTTIVVSRVICNKAHKIEMKHNGKVQDLLAKVDRCIKLGDDLFSELSEIARLAKICEPMDEQG